MLYERPNPVPEQLDTVTFVIIVWLVCSMDIPLLHPRTSECTKMSET